MVAYEYDVFLSYAIEDKIELANELYPKLKQRGLKVWYAGNELIVGESIHDIIMEGLEKSRFGIVLVTTTYFEKRWTLKELYTLMAREQDGQRVVIPVFHNISPEEVAIYDKLLAEKWALPTTMGLDQVADKIVDRVNKKERIKGDHKPNIKTGIIFAIFLLLLVIFFIYWQNLANSIQTSFFTPTIENRIAELNRNIEEDLKKLVIQENAQAADEQSIIQTVEYLKSLEVQYRNFYEFSNGLSDYQFRKNVQPASGFNFDVASPLNNYGFQYPNRYLVDKTPSSPYLDKTYVFFNTQPVTFTVEETINQDTIAFANVSYKENIRLLVISFEYTLRTSERKHTSYSLTGFSPEETYVFKKDAKGWIFSHIQQ